ncbi:MAG: Uma2 family endonuclease [Polyangiaceae bacterium]
MPPALPIARMTYAEFVASETASPVKREFIGGQVYAMAGGTPEHGALAAAVVGELRQALRGKPCRVYSSDLRVRITDTDMATYSDATVICGRLETATDDPNAAINPKLLVEVLSESTEAYDWGSKAAHYRRIPSLQEYVFVAQDEPRIEVYRRNDEGGWVLYEARSGERLELRSIGVVLDVSVVYENPLESN